MIFGMVGWSGAALRGVVGGVDAVVKGAAVVRARRGVVVHEERVGADHEDEDEDEDEVGEAERTVDGVVMG